MNAEANTQIQVTIDDQGNTGTGGSRTATETLNITIDLKPPVIAQGESVTASVDEDDVSTFTIPSITATDPNNEELTWSLHAAATNGEPK